MSPAQIHSRALLGLQAHVVTVEVHLANGLPNFTPVGLAETEVKEARERVRCAIQNAGLDFPTNKRITVNLAPADLPKDSGHFDLTFALGILALSWSSRSTHHVLRVARTTADLANSATVQVSHVAKALHCSRKTCAQHHTLAL